MSKSNSIKSCLNCNFTNDEKRKANAVKIEKESMYLYSIDRETYLANSNRFLRDLIFSLCEKKGRYTWVENSILDGIEKTIMENGMIKNG